jgi:hypothetical protein
VANEVLSFDTKKVALVDSFSEFTRFSDDNFRSMKSYRAPPEG